jgi:hypothetical protein
MSRIKLAASVLCVASILGSSMAVNASPTVRVAGVSVPRETSTAHCRLQLNGAGLYQAGLFHVDVYVAALYAETPSSSSDQLLGSSQTIQLWLRFKRDISRRDLIKAARTGLRAQLGKRAAAFGASLAELARGLRDLEEGDTVRITYEKGVGVAISINDDPCGRVAGDEFAKALFASWLGSHPISSQLKAQLLRAR